MRITALPVLEGFHSGHGEANRITFWHDSHFNQSTVRHSGPLKRRER